MPFKYIFIKIYCFQLFSLTVRNFSSLCLRIHASAGGIRLYSGCLWFVRSRAQVSIIRLYASHTCEHVHSNETILLNDLEMIVVLNFVLNAFNCSCCSLRYHISAFIRSLQTTTPIDDAMLNSMCCENPK